MKSLLNLYKHSISLCIREINWLERLIFIRSTALMHTSYLVSNFAPKYTVLAKPEPNIACILKEYFKAS